MNEKRDAMHITTNALVLREVAYKESDKILTLLTQEKGKLTATAHGCRKKGSPLSASCQQLFWSEFVLYQYKNRWTVKEVSILREFQKIPLDLERFALACYFAEVGELLSLEDLPQDDLLSLLLNCLYALDTREDLPLHLVKAVFELRAACQSGYEPMVDECSICQDEPICPQISLLHGTVHCQYCGGEAYPLTASSLAAIRYLIASHPKKIFHFHMENARPLADFCENYLLTQLDCHFRSLDYYHSLRKFL